MLACLWVRIAPPEQRPHLPLCTAHSYWHSAIGNWNKAVSTGKINSESNISKQRDTSMNVGCRLVWPIVFLCVLLVIHISCIYPESPCKKQPLQPWFQFIIPNLWLTFSMLHYYWLKIFPLHAAHQPNVLTHRVTKEMLIKQNKHPCACQLVLCKLALLQCPAIF